MQPLCVVGGENPIFGRRTLRSASTNDEAMQPVCMFRNMEACLSFAYSWRAKLGVKIGEIKEYTGKEGGTIMLSTHEKKAQASFILEVIASHLSLDQRAMLNATFGGENGERAAGIERLMHMCAGMHSNRHLVSLLLMREFIDSKRQELSQARIALECGVSPMTASRVAAKIMHAIGDLRDSTYEKLRPAFERRAWVAREASTNSALSAC